LLTLDVPIVVDPVMVASSGDSLNEHGTAAAMTNLFGLSMLVTPNTLELAALTDLPVDDEPTMLEAARSLAAAHACSILAKGGHLPGSEVTDLLVEPSGRVTRWSDTRIETRNSHGTGCTLSSAIATGLGAGLSLIEAVERARAYVRAAMLAAPGLGGGHGPMGHGLGRVHFPID
jgi:hydroxymethylpyrimidine/phosphomethylpyrimidine kinase